MNVQSKRKIKFISILGGLLLIFILAFLNFSKNEEVKLESPTEVAIEQENKEDDNENHNDVSPKGMDEDIKDVIHLSKKNCEYKEEKKTVTISKYEGTEECIIIPAEINGKKVEKIEKDAFEACYNLETIKVPVELANAFTEIECFEINEENSNEEYIELNTTREYSDLYKAYMTLTEEQREKALITPYKFEVSAKESTSFEVSATASDSQYDLRDYIQVEVENQGSHGTCYAYAALSSLETWIAKHRGELVDFSEIHAGVYSDGAGGFFSNVQSYINSDDGPVWEVDWGKNTYADKISSSDYNLIDSYLKGNDLTKSDLNHIKGLLATKQVEGEIKTKSYLLPSNNTIKNHILSYGALCSYYYHDDNYLYKNYNGYTVYNYNEYGSFATATLNGKVPDHAVCIIGWDDNFSRYNFPSDIRPDENGAFLVLNSWGENWGTDGGCFWVSYEDLWLGAHEAIGVSDVIGLGEEITLKDMVIKNADTGKNIETINGLTNLVRRGLKVEINLDLRYASSNTLVNNSDVTITVRNPNEDVKIKPSVKTKDGYIVINLDTADFSLNTDYIIDIVCKGETISRSIRIIPEYDYEVKDDGTIKLTAYKGKKMVDIIVPETYAGYRVTELGQKVFYNDEKIQTITIPSAIKTIGREVIPQGVIIYGESNTAAEEYGNKYKYSNKFLNIGETIIIGDFWEFRINTKYLIINGAMGDYTSTISPWKSFYRSVEGVTVNEGVETIGGYAFEGFTNLSLLQGFKDVTTIGNGAFSGCTNLWNNTVKFYKVTQIGKDAFKGCTSIITISGIENVITIGNNAFDGCTKLKNIPKLQEVNKIGMSSFKNCIKLEKIKIGRKIDKIDNSAFNGSGLSEIYGHPGTVAETFANNKGITFVPINVEKIEIISLPTIEKEELNFTGGKILATYSDYTTEEILMDDDDIKITGYDKDKLETQTLTLEFYQKTTTFDITIASNITGISISRNPDITTYVKGDPLNLAGGEIKVTYKKGEPTIKQITDDMVSGYNIEQDPGRQTITVTYKGHTTTFDVIVKNDVTEISIDSKTIKTEYEVGESLDLTGTKLVVTYENTEKKSIDITNEMVSGYDANTPGQQIITVMYEGKKAKFIVKVNNPIEKILINQMPETTTYIKGQELKVEGGTILVTYRNGLEETILMTYEGVDVSGYNKDALGIQNVLVKFKGLEATFPVEVTNNVTKVEIAERPNKIRYTRDDDSLNLTGGILKLTYQDGTSGTISMISDEVEASGYDTTKELGKQIITVTYKEKTTTNEKTTTFEVKLTEKIRNIEIIEEQTNNLYIKDDDLSGNIRITYEDDSTEDISILDKQVQIEGYDSGSLGEQRVTVTYEGKTAIFEVTVKNDITGIKVEKAPTKTEYIKGEALDLTGGEIVVTYENGDTVNKEITNEMVSGYDTTKEPGKQIITVTYEGKTAIFEVTVKNDITGIRVEKAPIKTTYIKGEALDLTGGKIVVTYENGDKSPEVDITNEMVTGYDANELGDQYLKVNYLGHETELKVTVITKVTVDTNGYASNIKLNINEKEHENPNNNLNKMNVAIEAPENHITYITGKIEAGAGVTEVQVQEKNGWKVEYNKETGKFVATKAEGAQSEEIIEITYKVTDTTQEKTNITIKDVNFTTIENEKAQGTEVSKEILIQQPPKEETPENPKDDNNDEKEEIPELPKEEDKQEKPDNSKDDSTNNSTQKVLKEIIIKKDANKRKYTSGEEFSTKGMKIVAKYSDGTEKEITNYLYAPYGELKNDDDKITIIYTEGDIIKTIEYDITVKKGNNNITNNTDKNENNNNTNNNSNTNNDNNLNTNNNEDTEKENINSFIEKYGIYAASVFVLVCCLGIYAMRRK